jgi:hypothetical protein
MYFEKKDKESSKILNHLGEKIDIIENDSIILSIIDDITKYMKQEQSSLIEKIENTKRALFQHSCETQKAKFDNLFLS